MTVDKYLMENDSESLRLELKTDPSVVKKQARWAGLTSGMTVIDVGCGPGITTMALSEVAQPRGRVMGVDFSQERVAYAESHYSDDHTRYLCKDIRDPLDELGVFDFVWVRFLLEYYRSGSFDIVKHLYNIVKPGGILCLVDLDHNCLSHYGIPARLDETVADIMVELQVKADFDPYAGRKLYSYLYDLHLEEIAVDVGAHHNIYGELKKSDEFNFLKKVEVAPGKINYQFTKYPGGYEEFIQESSESFRDPRRFTYTPIILCRGRKPL